MAFYVLALFASFGIVFAIILEFVFVVPAEKDDVLFALIPISRDEMISFKELPGR